MINHLEHVFDGLCRLDRSKPILVGVSGGPDSLCLMVVLAEAGYHVIVAHLNHSLRPEADEEAERVKGYARRLGLDFVQEKVDVQAIVEKHHISVEEAARTVRYRFLYSQADSQQAQAVAVGHTADDQVETILMHLLRGAGLTGLKGMLYRTLPTAWSSEIPLVRPLLGTWRTQVLEYISSHGYEPIYDASNLDVSYFRNRLRHELIPYLESYNPKVRYNLWHTGDVLGEDHLFIQREVDKAWQVCILDEGEAYLVFSRERCLEQPKAIQRYLIKRAIERLRPGNRDLDFDTLERAYTFLVSPTHTRKMELTSGLVISLQDACLMISDTATDPRAAELPNLPPGTRMDFKPPGALQVGGGWRIRATLLSVSPALREQIQTNSDPFQAWINADTLLYPFTVRTRLPGDRFSPLGMGSHSMKLSDFMVNIKLPHIARAGWPLVYGICQPDGTEEIIWLPGFRQSHNSRLTDVTQHILWLCMVRE